MSKTKSASKSNDDQLPPLSLTGEDAREAVENLTGFFRVLIGWAQEEAANTPDSGAENPTGERSGGPPFPGKV